MEPLEFKQIVHKIRELELALGRSDFSLSPEIEKVRKRSRSLFVVKDIAAGEKLTKDNIRSIRPGEGLHPKYYYEVLGKKAKSDIKKGTPLSWRLIM